MKNQTIPLNFYKILWTSYKNGNTNLLNSSENEFPKFATRKWYVIDSESKGSYSHDNPIKFLTKSVGSSLCDYSEAYILVTGDIAVKNIF